MTRWLLSLLYVLAYGVLDAITYVEPVLQLGITPWSPQAGLTVAFLLWAGVRGVPFTAVAAFLAEVLVRDASPVSLPHVAAALCIAATYGAMAASRGPALARDALFSLAPAMRFISATVAASLVAAVGYVASFVLAGHLPPESAMGSVLRYWIGDVNGILMLSPLLLVVPRLHEGLAVLRGNLGLALLQAAVVVASVMLLFQFEMTEDQRSYYPLFLPMIWVAVRWGAVGALLAAVVTQVAVVLALHGTAQGTPLLDLQMLNTTLVVTGLLLGVAVTERARARLELQERDRQLARAMRFAVAGEMSSSLTHELNQPITALVSYLQASRIMTGPQAPCDPRLAETLEKATREAIRAAEVMRRLRDFYQGTGTPLRGPADLAACCGSVLELLEARLRRQRVTVRRSLAPQLLTVDADRTQVEMVLHNLVSNAIDAMVAAGGRRELLIEARAGEGEVRLAVHDSGPGVAEEVLPQIFVPFNTTKADGMGLGLAISRNLLRAQGGELTYRPSERLGGACFEMRCPTFQ